MNWILLFTNLFIWGFAGANVSRQNLRLSIASLKMNLSYRAFVWCFSQQLTEILYIVTWRVSCWHKRLVAWPFDFMYDLAQHFLGNNFKRVAHCETIGTVKLQEMITCLVYHVITVQHLCCCFEINDLRWMWEFEVDLQMWFMMV